MLWIHDPIADCQIVNVCLQRALQAVTAFLETRGLQLSEAKTQDLILRPDCYMARRAKHPIALHSWPLLCRLTVDYLAMLFDCRLTWKPAVKALRQRSAHVLKEMRQLLARGNGCSQPAQHRVLSADRENITARAGTD